VPGLANVFLASGIRHDLALKDMHFIAQIARQYTGGHLKVAPEHVVKSVLKRMRKPAIDAFELFESRFLEASGSAGKQQYLVPYFIAGFPGCTPKDAGAVQRWLAKRGQRLKQCQIFIPLSGTAATAMVASGRDDTGARLFIPDIKEGKRQKALMVAPYRK
jgi:radical SAM superfamily enzyme YgiQ (UPF0313 family)